MSVNLELLKNANSDDSCSICDSKRGLWGHRTVDSSQNQSQSLSHLICSKCLENLKLAAPRDQDLPCPVCRGSLISATAHGRTSSLSADMRLYSIAEDGDHQEEHSFPIADVIEYVEAEQDDAGAELQDLAIRGNAELVRALLGEGNVTPQDCQDAIDAAEAAGNNEIVSILQEWLAS